jgi:hypothetical protein
MRLTLVLLPQELGGSFIGWLRIIALIGMGRGNTAVSNNSF